MTDTSEKLRALFLTALMVFSVFAGTVALSGAAAADTAGNAESFNVVFQGEELTVENLDDQGLGVGDILQIRQGLLGEEAGELVATAEVQDDFTATFGPEDTDGLAAEGVDRYHFLRASGSDLSNSQFEVQVQDLTASISEDRVTTNDPDAATLTISSENWNTVRGTNFTVSVNSDSLNQDQLVSVFGVDDPEGDQGEPITLEVDPAGSTFDMDLSGVNTGDITFSIASDESSASTTASVAYEEPEQLVPAASFSAIQFSEEIGDVASFTINLDNTSEGVVTLEGDQYSAEVLVVDGNDDGSVTVEFNTFEAGQGEGTEAFSAAADGDSASARYDTSELIPNTTTFTGDFRLASGAYDLTVYIDDGGLEEQDVATMSLNDRETSGADTIIAPSESFTSASDVSTILDGTRRTEVAVDDSVAVQVNVSGIFGYISTASDLSGMQGVSMTFEQQDPGRYQDPITVAPDDNGVGVVFDSANNQLFVVVDDMSAVGFEAGQEYDVTFEVSADNPYVDETESVSTTIELTERSTDFDLVEAPYDVSIQDGVAEVRGSSTLAPGSEFTVRALQSGNFLEIDEVAVTENGTFSATFENEPFLNGSGAFELSITDASYDGFENDTLDVSYTPAVFSDVSEWDTEPNVAQLEQQITDLQDRVSNLTATIDEMETLNSDLMTQLDEKNTTISDLETQVEDLQTQLDEAPDQETVDELESQVSDLQSQLDAAPSQDELDDLQSQLEDANSQVSSLQSTLEEKNSTISDLESTIEDKDAEIAELEEDLANAQDDDGGDTTTTSGPGFTAVLALVALIGAALLAVRREH